MHPSHTPTCTFLTDAVDPPSQWRALRNNLNTWFERWASATQSDGKGDSHYIGDILLTAEYATLPAASTIRDGKQLDDMLDWYRQRPDPRPAILYYISPEPPTVHGPKLLARGASSNWRPYWMWCDLDQTIGRIAAISAAAAEVDIRVVEELTSAESAVQTLNRAIEANPKQVYRIAAFRDGELLGSCVLNITEGANGIGGIFDMEVNPDHRRQGVGTALANWTRELAIHKGVRYMYLNSTPDAQGVYRKVGFESIGPGDGWSWHLPSSFTATSKPTEPVVAFLEALMLGDIPRLDGLAATGVLSLVELEAKTANGLTPVELAVLYKQSESVRWLIKHSVTPDVVSLWDLGWKAELKELIEKNPEVVNWKCGQEGTAALHTAVQRNDMDLLTLALSGSRVDLELKDDQFKSTAIGWAGFLGRANMLERLKRFKAEEAV